MTWYDLIWYRIYRGLFRVSFSRFQGQWIRDVWSALGPPPCCQKVPALPLRSSCHPCTQWSWSDCDDRYRHCYPVRFHDRMLPTIYAIFFFFFYLCACLPLTDKFFLSPVTWYDMIWQSISQCSSPWGSRVWCASTPSATIALYFWKPKYGKCVSECMSMCVRERESEWCYHNGDDNYWFWYGMTAISRFSSWESCCCWQAGRCSETALPAMSIR